MASTPALQRFAENELLRAPQVVQATLDDMLSSLAQGQRTTNPSARAAVGALTEQVRRHHLDLVNGFVQSVRDQVAAALSGRQPDAPATAQGSDGRRELRLVDDEAIAADVEISHCAEIIHVVAEFELRELETFASALEGDMQVSRPHNPFRPSVYARALWRAAHSVADEPAGLRILFMREASPALARVLRKSYAAACQRLEDSGITPAAYSTVVMPPSAKAARPTWTLTEEALRRIAEGLPALAAARSGHPAPAPSGAFEPRKMESHPDLLDRVLDAIVADPKLIPKSRQAISRLRPAVLRLAQGDAALLDASDHAVWRFVDRIGWLPEILPDAPHPDRVQVDQLTDRLIDHLLGAAEQTSELYRAALVRMMAMERRLFLARREAAAAQIESLDTLEHKAHLSGGPGVDSGEGATLALETMPGQMTDKVAPHRVPEAEVDAWIERLREGDHALLFIHGSWVSSVLLWRGRLREMWLWADCRSQATWPMRRSALVTLHSARLATSHQPRSLARLAARAISKQIARSRLG